MQTRIRQTILSAAAAAALGLAGTAGAVEVLFDADAGGPEFGVPGMDYKPVEFFKLDSVSNYNVNVDLGADGVLGVGDVFTESITYRLTQTADKDGNLVWTYNFKPGGGGTPTGTFVFFEVELRGVISSYDPGSDAPTSLACLGLGTCTVNDDIFGLSFDSSLGAVHGLPIGGSVKIWYDGNADLVGDMLIAELNVLDGGADNFSFDNPTATSDIGVLLSFLSAQPGAFKYASTGTDFADLLGMGEIILAVADSSVNLEGVGGVPAGAGDGDDLLVLTVSDNGGTARVVPEPVSAALVGLGLLGIGGLAQRRRQARS